MSARRARLNAAIKGAAVMTVVIGSALFLVLCDARGIGVL